MKETDGRYPARLSAILGDYFFYLRGIGIGTLGSIAVEQSVLTERFMADTL
jgi:hypothetical protein